jgi:hypothetical protein
MSIPAKLYGRGREKGGKGQKCDFRRLPRPQPSFIVYELTTIQQQLLWWELGLYTSAFLEWIDDGVESGGQSNSSAAANGEFAGQKRDEAIEKFLAKMRDAGLKVNKTDFSMVAGYEDATTFQRYKRYDPRTTATAVRNFENVLAMKPEEFKAALEKKRPK